MPLSFPGIWRFQPPQDGVFVNSCMSSGAVSDFIGIIEKLRIEKSRWWVYEHFKSSFGNPNKSSSESWALSDLNSTLNEAARNAPIFIESFYDACEELRSQDGRWFIPDVAFLNSILARHDLGYAIDPPNLILRDGGSVSIPVMEIPQNFSDRARNILDRALSRSEELLAEGRPLEAVQQILWLLETVSTAYRGLETQAGKVDGVYFNKIVGDLKRKMPGTTLKNILDWIVTMHGYLSAPGGGGVRHGLDLKSGIELDANQARLFCNLTRSYISFLIVEHASLSSRSQG